jgi:hypothetical protein
VILTYVSSLLVEDGLSDTMSENMKNALIISTIISGADLPE